MTGVGRGESRTAQLSLVLSSAEQIFVSFTLEMKSKENTRSRKMDDSVGADETILESNKANTEKRKHSPGKMQCLSMIFTRNVDFLTVFYAHLGDSCVNNGTPSRRRAKKIIPLVGLRVFFSGSP